MADQRDRAVFVGNPDDVVDDPLGPGLPTVRAWTERHFAFAGYVGAGAPVDREAARAALRQLPPAARADVTLHVNPADVELFPTGDDDGAIAPIPGMDVVPDGRVPAGSVVARTPLQSLPVDLQAALRAAEEVLRG